MPVVDLEAAADWKVLVEQWLENLEPQQQFVAPNQLLELHPEGALILQVVPVAPGRSRIRRFDYAARAAGGKSGRGGWRRRMNTWLHQQIELAESTQAGLASGLDESAETGPATPALAHFRETISALLRSLPEK